MQYSIVRKNKLEGAFRFDSEYYHPEYLKADRTIQSNPYKKLKNLAIKITDFGAYSQNNFVEYKETGFAVFIRNQDIYSFFVQDDERIFIEKEVYERLSLHLEENDILVQRVGTLGKASIVFKKDLPSTANQNLAQVKIDKEKINPFYLISFLNSSYGIMSFERLQTGNVQPWLNLQQMRDLKIPIFSPLFQADIEEIVNMAFHSIELSKKIFTQAQTLLLTELGLADWQPKHRLTFVKNYHEVKESVRMDAEYFQPKYEEIVESIKTYAGGWDTLGNVTNPKKQNFQPESNRTYKYIELANIAGNGEITSCTVEEGQNLPSRARRKVSKGDLIVSSIEGSLSSIALIGAEYHQALCSTGFHVINSSQLNGETLLVLLKSMVGQLQLKKGCSGTILTAINNGEFSRIILPIISQATQNKIQEKVRQSFKLRAQSKKLLESAKRAVEIAIEENEEKALNWLAEKTFSAS